MTKEEALAICDMIPIEKLKLTSKRKQALIIAIQSLKQEVNNGI